MPSSLSRLAAPFGWVWHGISWFFGLVHKAFVYLAWPLGVGVENPWYRYGLFTLAYAIVYALGWFAPAEVAVVAIGIGILWVIAVSQAWAWNEQRRIDISKKIIPNESPDSLPSLRLFAILSALQLLILLPLLCQRLHLHAGLFVAEEGAQFHHWVWFVLDKTYLKALPDWTFLQKFHVDEVRFSTPLADAEKFVLTIAWVLLYYILVQGGFREWRIRRNLADAVAAVRVDPDLAVRHGQRIVRSLLWRLREPNLAPPEQVKILEALGHLHAEKAFDEVRRLAEDPRACEEVRIAACVTLGRLGVPETLLVLEGLLRSDLPGVRAAAARGLGECPWRGAMEHLLQKLRAMRREGIEEPDPNVRGQVVLALGKAVCQHGSGAERREVLSLILRPSPSLLEDPYLRVRSRATTALAELGDPEAIGPLMHLIETTPNPKLLKRAIPLLAGLAKQATESAPIQAQRATDTLLRCLTRYTHDDVRIVICRAMAKLGVTHAVDKLSVILREALQSDHLRVADAARQAMWVLGQDPIQRAKQIGHQYNRRRSRQRLARLLDEKRSVAERCLAAEEVAKLDGAVGEATLRRVYEDRESPEPLKEAVLHALRRVNSEAAEELARQAQKG